MPYNNQLIESLKSLKAKLNGQNMSVLVGSGFSKNASLLFPSWFELLFDMAKEMFENKINDEYSLLKKIKKGKVESYSDFLKRKITFEINSIGYLQIVSDYIKQKGYREIVETYIEAKTPRVSKNEKIVTLQYWEDKKLKKQILKTEDLILHNKLIELPWNNIYTTNYDHLLEICIDENIKNELELKVKELAEQIDEKEIKREKDCVKLGELVLQIKQQKELFEILITPTYLSSKIDNKDTVSHTPINENKEQIENEIKELEKQSFQLKYETDSASEIIKENSNTIIKFTNLINDCLSVITHSSELAIKRDKNIIKLHGSLRAKVDDDFGFDSDVHKHYVIAKEDYETYPKTHEAFTQLMRISLLQESFCLIGFSGVDPNFLAWIGWVRDIILRKKSCREQDKLQDTDKIYLIELDKELPSADKTLFYRNHRIAHIPLLENNCVKFLENETGKKLKNKSSKKEALLLFTEYLNDGMLLNKPKIALELLKQEEYQNAWSDLPIDGTSEINLNDLLSKANKIFANKKYNRIPSLNFPYSHSKHSLLFFAKAYFEASKTKEEKSKVSQLLNIALQDQFLPYSVVYNHDNIFDKIISSVTKNTELFDSYRLLQLKDCVWKNDTKRFIYLLRNIKADSTKYINEINYQKALIAAFNFNYKGLYEILKKWNPDIEFVAKKAGLESLINIDEAISTLKGHQFYDLQEELYANDLLDFLNRSKHSYKYDRKLREKIKAIENEGLKTIDENIDYIINEINKEENKKDKLKPYGKGKFSVGHPITISNISTERLSIQFFGILMEGGFPLVIGNSCYKNQEKVYSIAKKVFSYVPFPTLFYCLQYHDSDFLKRLGQDYAYSDALSGDIKIISHNIQRSYFDLKTPSKFKENALIFYSELLVVLPPENWQNFFIKEWNIKLTEKNLFTDFRYKDNDFLFKGLRFIKAPKIISKVISDCIDNLEKDNGNAPIRYLYELTNNYWLEKEAKNIKTISLTKKIRSLIERIPKLESSPIFALGNIYIILNTNEKKIIKKKLSELDFSKITNERVWHIILYFADGDIGILNNAKKTILKHPKLWNSGITDKGGTIPYDFISLYKLRKSQNPELGIQWSKKEKLTIFSRLQNSFAAIQKFTQRREDVFGYEGILEEMLYFIEDEMSDIDDIEQTLNEVKKLYFRQRGYESITDGLIANDQSKIVWSLNEVSKEIYQYKKIEKCIQFIELVLNKLLVKSEPGLGACLQYLAMWIYDFREKDILKQFKPQILKIIELYQANIPEEIDKPFLIEKLIRLSFILKGWGVKDSLINQQLEAGKNSRFNNIKFAIKDIRL